MLSLAILISKNTAFCFIIIIIIIITIIIIIIIISLRGPVWVEILAFNFYHL